MQHFIAIQAIKISPTRQRREFKQVELQELVTSIRDSSHGLLHALVLRREGPDFVLVAGERRLRAIQDIYDLTGTFLFNGEPVPPGLVPYNDLGELTEIEAWEAELEENIRRVDLTWQEKAQATSALMRLRETQASAADLPTPSVGQIAREVRPEQTYEAAHDATRKELIVSRYLHDPEVKAAPNVNEAFKILKKKEATKQNTELAARIGTTFSSAAHTLKHANAQEWLAGQQAASFDIILTDPPYGMGADEFSDSGVGTSAAAHFYPDSPAVWFSIMEWFPAETFRLAKPDAHLYAFCDIDKFAEFRIAMTCAGWKVHRTPLIWSNPDGFRAPWPKQGPQRKYELVLYAVKGAKEVTSVRGDVLEYRKDAALGHPAQKPVNLLVDLLKRSAKPDDQVLDPFAGSGATIEACNELKLRCTAIEMDAAAYGIALKRLQGLAAFDGGLF